jgi:hypothetical protein
MNNWDLNDSFDKFGSAYFKSYDETNNIALDISGYLIIRHDIILYNGLSLNNTLSNLQSQYDLISISGLLNSILYLNSVDTYFNHYVETLSGQINLLKNSLSRYSDTTSLMNNVTDLNNYTISLSGIIQNYYFEYGAKNMYFSSYLLSISDYVFSLCGRIKNYYVEQGAKNNYFSTYLLFISDYVLSLSGRIQNYYIEQGSKNYYFSTYLNSLSDYVLSLSGRFQNYYIEQKAKNNYLSTYLLSISDYVLSLSGRIHNNYYYQNSINIFFNYITTLSGNVNAYLTSLFGKINDLYYNKILYSSITNNGALYQVDKSLFYNGVCISGALLFATNFDNFDNTDLFYKKKYCWW